MAASDLQLRKRNNYKLLSDPELKKGAKKTYRINGKAGEGVAAAPEPEDPRAQKTVLGVTGRTLDMILPRFKYDKYWIGPPPERDVFVIGLNESVKASQLKDLCSAVAPVQSIKFHRHPKTKAFLGAVTICFCYCGSGKKAVETLDGVIIGGCYLRAELDDQGEHLERYLEPVLKFLQEKGIKDESADDLEDGAVRRSSVSESGPEHSESEGEQSLPLSAAVSTSLSPPLKLYPFSILNAATLNATTPSSHDIHVFALPTDLRNQPPQNPLEACRPTQSYPPLPPSEPAPPLPPLEQSTPPLPPPPLPVGDPHTVVENISSDEEHGGDKCQPTSTFVSISPSKSPDHAKFDPSLGLQTLLKSNSMSNVSHGCTPSILKNNSVTGVSHAPSSPHFSSGNYELEVEEISGDDSPIMVYKSDFEPLQLESISDVDSTAGGDDMEVCSDDEVTQIELNVKPTRASTVNTMQQIMFPPCLREDRVYVSGMAPAFAHLQLPTPSMHFTPPLPAHSSDLYEPPVATESSSHLSLAGRHGGSKLQKVLVNNTKEAISVEVLVKALEQLKAILLNDVQKKLVEASAFSVLDGFWDKERRTRGTDNAEQQPAKPPEPYRRMLPGLKLGQDVATSSDAGASCTPRKRLLNFKIPLVNRIGHRREQNLSVVRRRRIFSDQEDKISTQPQQESYIATLSDVTSGDEFSSAESTESDYENEDSDYVGSHEQHSPASSTELLGSIRNPADVGLAEEGLCQLQKDAETLLNRKSDLHNRISHIVPETVRTTITPSRAVFKRRSPDEEEKIVFDIFLRGLEWEEVQMFRLALSELKHQEEVLVADIHWSHYPHSTNIPLKRRRVDHITGCARSEGYYKIDIQEKLKYLPHHRVKSTGGSSKKKTTGSGRVNRANQRRLASVYSGGDVSNDLAKYNQLKARKKLIKFAKSTIHNWGLFAMENIAADEMVIEYIGEVVRQTVADERERRYEAAGIGSSYLFRVDHDYIIDATRNGNLARFINHCCDPNCYAKVISFGMQKKIIIYSKRDIAMGEEITYDYKFPIEDEKIPCLCGAPNCRGTLN